MSHSLCSDGRRSLVAVVVALAVPLAAGLGFLATDPERDWLATDVVLALAGWNIYVVGYVALTMRVFSGVDADEFAARMELRARRRTRTWSLLSPGGDGPTFAVEAAVVAFAVVLVLPHVGTIAIDALLLVPISISILLSSWALAVVAYALHYAQYDLDEPGLEFPGTRTRAFADYRYFSVAVATTFGATDVNITTPRMRRVVNVHTLLTFVYNSVIVALLASFLTR